MLTQINVLETKCKIINFSLVYLICPFFLSSIQMFVTEAVYFLQAVKSKKSLLFNIACSNIALSNSLVFILFVQYTPELNGV